MGRTAKSERTKARIKSVELSAEMQKAVDAYHAMELRTDGKRKTLRDLHDEYKVSTSALGRHVNGGIGIAEFNKTKQKLLEPVEEELEAWALGLADRGLSLSNALLEEKANRILLAQDPNAEPVGVSWVTRYLTRRGDKLRSHWSRPLERIRQTSATEEAVRAYFKQYISLVGEDGSKIEPHLQFAFDETGLQPSLFRSERVIGHARARYATTTSSTNRQLTTFVPVISAGGNFITGLMIFPAKFVRQSYLGSKGNPHDLRFVQPFDIPLNMLLICL